MARPNPRYSIPDQRDLIYETELENNLVKYRNEGEIIAKQNGWNPDFIDAPFPNEWEQFIPRSDGEILVGWHGNKIETAIIYTQAFLNYRRVNTALAEYHCFVYPKSPSTCQNLAGGGYDISIPERVLVGLKRKLQENREGKTNGIKLPDIGIKLPEILPSASAAEEQITPPKTQCYIVHGQELPLTQQAVDYYRNLGVTVTPCQEPEPTITDNMITQKIDYFTIESGRAIGQITFTATQNFNPFYYNKTISNIIKFEDHNGANILPTVKQNNLRFTATERTETIQYDEGMHDNIYAKVSSFVWSSLTTPIPFSKQLEFEIREKEPVKPISSGFMAAGALGAIAGLVLLGFIVDSKVGK